MISTSKQRIRKCVRKPLDPRKLENLAAKMTRHDCNQNEELVLYCDVMTEKAVYRIQPGLTSGGFYRNRKKARKVQEARNKSHKDNNSMYERSVSGESVI